MDQDKVRVYMVLGPVDDGVTFEYTPVMPRWRAVDTCRDFGAGVPWKGRPVLRALIVEVPT